MHDSHRLGISWPIDLYNVYSIIGNGDFGSFELVGVLEESKRGQESNGAGVVMETLEHREEFGLPKEFVIVKHVGDGSFWVVKTDDESGAVCIWAPFEMLVPEPTGQTFGELFYERIKEEVDYWSNKSK